MIRTARTRPFAVLGDPVGHSLSPLLQNAAFRAAGIDAVYVALRPSPKDVPSVIASLVRSGGGGNITIPYKSIATEVEASRTERVTRLGVANVFGAAGEVILLDNTDVDGVGRALDRIEAPSTAWLLIGTGGSARAVVGAAGERGAAIAVRSRSAARAAEFAAWMADRGVAAADPESCEVVINATPLGLRAGDPLPLDPTPGGPWRHALDLVYRHEGPTPWVRACREAGWVAADGREALLWQGVASWRTWFPEIPPPVAVMRATLDGRLR